MKDEQLEMLHEAITKYEESIQMFLEYWKLYSHMGTWQFWVIFVFFLVIPLLILYFTLDRDKIFLIGFYGFNINVWLTLISTIGAGLGWWDYPYKLVPFTVAGFSINSATVPVLFMLVYQWTLNHKKNFYLFSLLGAIISAFVLGPLLVYLNFLQLNISYFQLLLVYTGIFLFSKLITSTFLFMQKTKIE